MFQVKYKDGGIDMSDKILSEVFEYEILDMNNEILFTVKTTKANTIQKNRLVIEDAIVNTRLFSDMMNGVYNDKFIKVFGKTVVRSLDEDTDKDMLFMTINVAMIESYKVSGRAGDGAYGSVMVINFNDRDKNHDKNFNLELQAIEDYRKKYDKFDEGYTFFE